MKDVVLSDRLQDSGAPGRLPRRFPQLGDCEVDVGGAEGTDELAELLGTRVGGSNGAQSASESRMSTLIVPLNGSLI